MTAGWLLCGEAPPPRVEFDVRHEDILKAEADALGCLVTPSLEPDDEASRRLFSAAGAQLREDLRWALARRARPRLAPGEALTVAVRREYPVGRVGFLMLAASVREPPPAAAEELVLGAFLDEALEWGFESVALPVSEHGLGVTLLAATRRLASLTGERRPLLRRLQLVACEAGLLEGWQEGVA